MFVFAASELLSMSFIIIIIIIVVVVVVVVVDVVVAVVGDVVVVVFVVVAVVVVVAAATATNEDALFAVAALMPFVHLSLPLRRREIAIVHLEVKTTTPSDNFNPQAS